MNAAGIQTQRTAVWRKDFESLGVNARYFGRAVAGALAPNHGAPVEDTIPVNRCVCSGVRPVAIVRVGFFEAVAGPHFLPLPLHLSRFRFFLMAGVSVGVGVVRGYSPLGVNLRGKSCWCLVLRRVLTSPLPPFEGGP